MIKNFLIKRSSSNNKIDRGKISRETSFLGLLSNLFLSFLKVVLYLITGSLAILSDAINNITDCASSIISIVGMKFAQKPRDEDHPYGHGRLEYLITLVVCGIILSTAFEFIRASIQKILHPVELSISNLSIFIILVSIFVKVWQYRLYKSISREISSSTLAAQASDALMDCLVTSLVVISSIMEKFSSFRVDGYVGLIIAAFIIFNALTLIKETISSIIGERLSDDMKTKLINILLDYDEISNVHRIIVTDFGPDEHIVVTDVEMPFDLTLEQTHSIIDKAERAVKKLLDIKLIIHPEPRGTSLDIVKKVSETLDDIVFYDSRLVIYNDIVVEDINVYLEIGYNAQEVLNYKDKNNLRHDVERLLNKAYPDYKFHVRMQAVF